MKKERSELLCRICKSQKIKTIFSEFGIDTLKCLTCGHIFSSYKQEENYDGYFRGSNLAPQEQFWWNEAHRDTYSDFCDKFLFKRRGKLLDVGCGLGYFVKYISQSELSKS